MFKINGYYVTVESFLTIRKRFMEGSQNGLDEILANDIFGDVDITSSEAINTIDNAITDGLERIELYVRLNDLSFEYLREYASYDCGSLRCGDCKYNDICGIICRNAESNEVNCITDAVNSVIQTMKGK